MNCPLEGGMDTMGVERGDKQILIPGNPGRGTT